MSETNVSVEISMYPLTSEYIPVIDNFLSQLHNTEGLKVKTNVMSTQVFGEINLVFSSLQKEIARVYRHTEQCPFVIKVLNSDISEMEIKNYRE